MDIDIDTMEAGREMDALVAERVMGWTQVTVHEDYIPETEYYDNNGVFMCYKRNWNPTTDIAAAIKVWQKLAGAHEIGFDYGHHEAGGELYLDHECIAQSDECTDVEAAFCLATCRAALKATGLETS